MGDSSMGTCDCLVEAEKEYQAATAKFAEVMANRLYDNHDKGGWDDCSHLYLFRRLLEEVGELMEAYEDGETTDGLLDEAADVANFAMMIADKLGAAR